eukprot:TRINITY_DN33540_c0_g1_i1.p1 TRINITY_DN33540_c0_g1~~TRINITY_DN33540_c0_g1_i1.p1  ORF type:complete len:632 (+),score=105.87 TRINITY_DN33540_c0_g1_i1:58-1896(+)
MEGRSGFPSKVSRPWRRSSAPVWAAASWVAYNRACCFSGPLRVLSPLRRNHRQRCHAEDWQGIQLRRSLLAYPMPSPSASSSSAPSRTHSFASKVPSLKKRQARHTLHMRGLTRAYARTYVILAGVSRHSRLCRRRQLHCRSAAEAGPLDDCPPPVLYQQRWVQLAFLALLALLSDLVCFSVAAIPATWKTVYGEDPATLIDIFLFTNVGACFLEPYLISKFGLRVPIVGAAWCMAVGCLLRSGVPFAASALPSYSVVVAGTMLVAVAQPFFQCTPPLLSATWFAPDERALSTAIAINFNQVGIATAFLVGGAMGRSEAGLTDYFAYISLAALIVATGSLLFFAERPPTPPSASELEKLQASDDGGGVLKQKGGGAAAVEKEAVSFPEQASQLLRTPGFIPPLSAFVTSIAVTNVVGAFMDQKLEQAGFSDPTQIDFAGAGFELAIVIGGIVLGGVVDRNKEYKAVTLVCLVLTLGGVVLLGLDQIPRQVALLALLAIGGFAGPVQPINAELAVEVSFPFDENAIEAVQQLCGNLISALLVPLCEAAAEWTSPALPGTEIHLRGDTVVLVFILLLVTAYFSTFDAPLRRTEVDNANCIIDKDSQPVLKKKGE